MIELQMLPGMDGDCLLLTYGDENRTRRVLIDGGRAGTYPLIKPTLRNISGGMIDVLCVTHVDRDHVMGVLKMLEDGSRPVDFADVWFNGFDHLNDSEFETFGAQDGEKLTTLLTAQNMPWNKAFRNRAIEIGRPQDPFDDEASFTIVAPDRALLESMIPVWVEECAKHGLIPGVDPEEPQPEPEFEEFGALDVDAIRSLAEEPFKPDDSPANITSISFLFEFDDTRILFTGDGDVPCLVEALRPMAEAEGGRLRIDALKVPHHGSEHNISQELLELIDCRRYLISTNGVTHGHPKDVAMARILVFGGDEKEIVFNYGSRADKWRRSALQNAFNYTVTGPDGDDGFVTVGFD